MHHFKSLGKPEKMFTQVTFPAPHPGAHWLRMLGFPWLPSRRAVLVLLLAAALGAPAQDSSPPPPLGDTARQARDEKPPATTSPDSKRLAQEIFEPPESGFAPPEGLRYYRDEYYQLLLPERAEAVAHDEQGIIFFSAGLDHPRALVLIGDPIPFEQEYSPAAMQDLTRAFAAGFQASWYGAYGLTVNGRKAFGTSLSGSKLGHRVRGNVELIYGDGTVFPVFCGLPTTADDERVIEYKGTIEQRKAALDSNARRSNEISANSKLCEAVLASVILRREKPAAFPSRMNRGKTSPAPLPVSTPPGEPPSLAQLAEQARRDKPVRRARRVVDDVGQINPTPDGFQGHPETYCDKEGCYDLFYLLPADAQAQPPKAYEPTRYITTSGKAQGEIAIRLGGITTRYGEQTVEQFLRLTDPDFILRKEVAGNNPPNLIIQEYVSVNGRPARHLRYVRQNPFGNVITDRIVVYGDTLVVIECSTRENDFGKFETVFHTVLNSVRVPWWEADQQDDPDDPPGDDPPSMTRQTDTDDDP